MAARFGTGKAYLDLAIISEVIMYDMGWSLTFGIQFRGWLFGFAGVYPYEACRRFQ